uniref:Vps72/YL1 C-terminal domain-containing protein n=1 Tax=Crocodylus porosus TaxID=8502 RepID=A0A7M4F7H0_CROPO
MLQFYTGREAGIQGKQDSCNSSSSRVFYWQQTHSLENCLVHHGHSCYSEFKEVLQFPLLLIDWNEANYTDPQSKLRFSTIEEFAYIRMLPSDVVTGYLALRKATSIVS